MTDNTKLLAPKAARYLRIAASMLAKLCCSGGGPRFAKAGPRLIIYDRADLDSGLDNRICHSTSEYDALAKRARLKQRPEDRRIDLRPVFRSGSRSGLHHALVGCLTTVANVCKWSVPLISIKEAAKLFGKTVRTVRRWQAAGMMPPRAKHRHCMMYRRDDIKAMVAANSAEVSA